MIIKTSSVILLLMILNLCLNARKDKPLDAKNNKTSNQQHNVEYALTGEFKSKLKPNQYLELGKVYTDAVNYTAYNDDYDYWQLKVDKNKQTIALIYTDEMHSKFIIL